MKKEVCIERMETVIAPNILQDAANYVGEAIRTVVKVVVEYVLEGTPWDMTK